MGSVEDELLREFRLIYPKVILVYAWYMCLDHCHCKCYHHNKEPSSPRHRLPSLEHISSTFALLSVADTGGKIGGFCCSAPAVKVAAKRAAEVATGSDDNVW